MLPGIASNRSSSGSWTGLQRADVAALGRRTHLLVVFQLLMALPPIAAHGGTAPQITNLSDTTLARSGRLLVIGFDFGGTAGQVLIDGQDAIVTQWSNTEIHAYIPESAALGIVPVQVVTSGGAGNTLMLEVTLREPDGRVQWRFQVDGFSWVQFISIAPDGTIYTSDGSRLYALSPDGALQWIHEEAGLGGPISFGADGTIYTQGSVIKAINPDGSLRWHFPNPVPTLVVLAGPNVGPDGNIYAIQDSNIDDAGYGVFALDPDGNLLFSNVQFMSTAVNNSDIVFGEDLFFAGINHFGNGPSLKAYSYDDGEITWDQGGMSILGGGWPILDPFGRIIYRWQQGGMQAITPQGNVDWSTVHPGSPNYLNHPTVASDGVVYASDSIGLDLWSLDVDGNTLWAQPTNHDHNAGAMSISPDDAMLIVTGAGDNGGPDFRGWIRGYDPADGAFIWHVGLGNVNGVNEFATVREPKFSHDNLTTYVTTKLAGLLNYGYLYAIDVPFDATLDGDADGYADVDDNCPEIFNPDQIDNDVDGIGDACDFISDNCSDALPICPGTITGSTVGATNDGASSCNIFPDLNKDVWFAYTPESDGVVTVDGCGSPYSYYLSVHSGCPGMAANEIGCANDGCPGGWPQVTFDGIAGQTYWIRVTGFSSVEIDYTLTLTGAPCADDNTDLNGDGVIDAGDLALLLGSWGPCPECPADFDGDGAVNAADLALLLGDWN